MARISVKLVTPGKIIVHLFALVALLWHGISTVGAMMSRLDLSSQESSDVSAQVKAIKRRIAVGEDELQVFVLPEGPFLTNMFYGTSLINLCLSHPEDSARQETTRRELEQIYSKVQRYKDRFPFNQTDRSLPGGIIYCGNLNRFIAGYILIGGTDAKMIEQFHQLSTTIHQAFLNANPPFPESFIGLTWPVDGVPALDSLRLHDQLYGTTYSSVSQKWLSWLKNHIDPETGLMIAQAGKTEHDAVVDGTRGCAMSWTLALLPSIDAEFAREQYGTFREQWFVPFGGGLLGVQEWFKGKEKPSDFKVGPVVGGLGAAATGLGIATARANSDWESWNKFLRGLETFGFPLCTIYGEKTYFFGQSLLCDSIALWGKTITPWKSDVKPIAFPAAAPDSFVLPIALAASLAAIGSALLLFRITSLLRRPVYTRVAKNKVTIAVASLQSVLFLLWIFVPLLSWMQVILIMAIVDLMEEMTLRPKIVGDIFRAQENAESI